MNNFAFKFKEMVHKTATSHDPLITGKFFKSKDIYFSKGSLGFAKNIGLK
jgi:hypothetical protein